MDGSNVINLRGSRAAPEVVPTVVKALEEALESARSGNTLGVVIVQQHPNRLTTAEVHGLTSYGLLGRLQAIGMHIVAVLAEG